MLAAVFLGIAGVCRAQSFDQHFLDRTLRLDYTFSGNALVGDPTDPDVLRQGGIENCDAVAAVSEDDSLNLMAAQIAKSLFQREKVICRVSDPHLQVLYHKAYELDTICPTILTEQAVFRALAK